VPDLTGHAVAGRHRSGPGLYAVGLISAALAWVVGVLTAYRILSAIAEWGDARSFGVG